MLNEWVWLPFLIRFFQIQLLYQGELFFILFVTVIVECRRQQKLNSWNALAMERWRKSSRKSPCTQLPEWQGGGSIILKCNEHYPSLISYDSHSWRKTIHLKENAGDEWSRHTRFKPRAENYQRKNGGVDEGEWGWVSSSVWLFATPGTGRQEYWSGLPFSPPGNLPNSSIEPTSHAFPALADGLFTTGKPKE